MKRVMLYFGSFNPVHAGHLAIANYAVAEGFADELRFVVSPRNPFKEDDFLAPEHDRLRMVEIGIENAGLCDIMCACDVEFSLTRPSFTINTLEKLWHDYPDCEFRILMGGDNFASIKKWKDYGRIIESCSLFVYMREGADCTTLLEEFPSVTAFGNAPVLNISSTQIRGFLEKGMRIPALLPCGVYDYITKNGLYETDG